jgi:hypothetical protein
LLGNLESLGAKLIKSNMKMEPEREQWRRKVIWYGDNPNTERS